MNAKPQNPGLAWALVVGVLCGCNLAPSGEFQPSPEPGGVLEPDNAAPSILDPNGSEDPSGGQTGDGSGGIAEAALACATQQIELSSLSEEREELGFAPRALLDNILGPRDTSVRWAPSEYLTASPEDGVGTLKVELQYREGAVALLVPTEQSDAGAHCPPTLQLEALLSLSSATGALMEELPVRVTATTAASALFTGELIPDLSGSLQLLSSEGPLSLSLLTVHGEVSDSTTTGSLTGQTPTAYDPTTAEAVSLPRPAAESGSVETPDAQVDVELEGREVSIRTSEDSTLPPPSTFPVTLAAWPAGASPELSGE